MRSNSSVKRPDAVLDPQKIFNIRKQEADMHRREVLSFYDASLVSLAGCSSLQRDGRRITTSTADTPSTKALTTPPTATAAEMELTVVHDALQSALAVLNIDYLEL